MSEAAVRILIVDDSALDAELMTMVLTKAGMPAEIAVAVDEVALRELARTFSPDVILCDFSMPGMDGSQAQAILRQLCGDTPLIFVSGTLSETQAVSALQSDAVDYVLKSNLLRLPTAVERAVREFRDRKRLEASLFRSEERARQQAERLEVLWRVSSDSALRGAALIVAMLHQAARSFRPLGDFHGVLGRVEGEEFVIVATSSSPGDPSYARFGVEVGARRLLVETGFPKSGRTQAWHDLESFGERPARITELGWRSAITTQFHVAAVRYSLTFASYEVTTPFDAEDMAYLDILAMSLGSHIALDALERSLREQDELSRLHAERLEKLWQLVNGPHQSDAELWLAMLRSSAVSIWPHMGSRATLWRVHDQDLVLEAVAETSDTGLGVFPVTIGATIPYGHSIVESIVEGGGGTRTWDDLALEPELESFTSVDGLRALIVRTFEAGGTQWALSFGSGQPVTHPIGADDRAYIEVLASYFAHHVQARWQRDRISYQQSHDVLTGLLTRSQFRSQVRAAVRRRDHYALVLLDVNAFGEINAAYGNMIGDALLVEVGSAIRQRAGIADIVGRNGGDVFGVYMESDSRDDVAERVRAVADAFSEPFSTGDRLGAEFVALTASIGVAVAPDDGIVMEAVLSHAEAALVAAKQRGSGSTVFFAPGMDTEAPRRAVLRNELAEALAGDQFALYFRPHVDLNTGDVSGCEALIRWRHPRRGIVMPGEFIPFAEQTGMITGIDAWVMHHAFAAANELGEHRPGFRLYFNLSGRQAGDAKVVRAFATAARRGVNLRNIGVEITETDAMRDVEATRRVCRALRRLGVLIAIDDFGTGYSSLSSLKRLPVDIVKIDRSFIAGLLTDPHDAAIADTIISIAARFGFESLAEGVESLGEIDWLRQRACRYMQGYAICHPLPIDDFRAWLAARDG